MTYQPTFMPYAPLIQNSIHNRAQRPRNFADRGHNKVATMADSSKTYNRHAPYLGRYQSTMATPYAAGNHGVQNYGMPHNSTADLSALTHSFQGMNMQTSSYAHQAKNPVLPNSAGAYSSMPVATSMPPNMYNNPGQYIFPGGYGGNSQSPGMYTPHAAPYVPQVNYPGYQQHDNSPLSNNWTPTTTGATQGEVPTLITPRRDSISSTENDQPATPSYAGYPMYTNGGVAINRSPSGVFTHSTPSPTSMMAPFGMGMMKHPEQADISPRIKLLITQEPAIPRAIPAPSSPLKPLDRALENQRGETNVYIRGLLPETTDDMLEAWGTRFGDIKSSKSIIDHNTGLCKGFGFVKYHNYEDAENCIRGFHFLGYEESFYSKLKTFADEGNTNLYVSNLPKSMNEHELTNLFAPHKVCSTRILRDKNGHGRGVGFARFESRDSCEEVIKEFNNHTINTGGEELEMQIRYADTQDQKALKQQTQAARQFRSAEYEYATQAWRQGRLPLTGTTFQDNTSNSTEFDQYLGTTATVPIQGQRWAQSVIRQSSGRSPLGGLPYSNSSQAASTAATSSGTDVQAKGAAAAGDAKMSVTSPKVTSSGSPVDSANASEQD